MDKNAFQTEMNRVAFTPLSPASGMVTAASAAASRETLFRAQADFFKSLQQLMVIRS